jgi:hypothetical protein
LKDQTKLDGTLQNMRKNHILSQHDEEIHYSKECLKLQKFRYEYMATYSCFHPVLTDVNCFAAFNQFNVLSGILLSAILLRGILSILLITVMWLGIGSFVITPTTLKAIGITSNHDIAY